MPLHRILLIAGLPVALAAGEAAPTPAWSLRPETCTFTGDVRLAEDGTTVQRSTSRLILRCTAPGQTMVDGVAREIVSMQAVTITEVVTDAGETVPPPAIDPRSRVQGPVYRRNLVGRQGGDDRMLVELPVPVPTRPATRLARLVGTVRSLVATGDPVLADVPLTSTWPHAVEAAGLPSGAVQVVAVVDDAVTLRCSEAIHPRLRRVAVRDDQEAETLLRLTSTTASGGTCTLIYRQALPKTGGHLRLSFHSEAAERDLPFTLTDVPLAPFAPAPPPATPPTGADTANPGGF